MVWNPGGGTAKTVGGITGYTALTFPAGLGDDPRQPYFMTFQPKKITSAIAMPPRDSRIGLVLDLILTDL